MVRGAAKNHATVAIVTDPADYALVASRVADGTGFSLDERKWLAAKAFAHTAAYDATINEWTAKHWPKPASLDAVEVDKDDQALKSIPPSSRPISPAPGIVRTPCATARTPTSRPPSTSTRSTRPVSPTPSSSAASR